MAHFLLLGFGLLGRQARTFRVGLCLLILRHRYVLGGFGSLTISLGLRRQHLGVGSSLLGGRTIGFRLLASLIACMRDRMRASLSFRRSPVTLGLLASRCSGTFRSQCIFLLHDEQK